jgi:hypothetical protein
MNTQNSLSNDIKTDIVKTDIVKTDIVKTDIVKTDIVKTDIVKTDIVETNNSSNVLLNNLEELYKYIKTIHENRITTLNIILITSELIQIVEKYKNLTGSQKKMLVINVLKKIINEQVTSEEEKLALNLIINNVVPQTIDGFVDAINGVVKFTKNIKPNFFKKIFCCFYTF